MKKVSYLKYIGLCSLLGISSEAYAGAGANVGACVNFSTPTLSAVTYTFNPYETSCMNQVGTQTSVTVPANSVGLFCAPTILGYVESEQCIANEGWDLACTTSDNSYSATAVTSWSTGWIADNEVDLSSSSTNIGLCPGAGASNPSLCSETTYKWNSGTVGSFNVIFNPQAH